MNILDQQGALVADLRENVAALSHEVAQLHRALEEIANGSAKDPHTSAKMALVDSQDRRAKRAAAKFTR